MEHLCKCCTRWLESDKYATRHGYRSGTCRQCENARRTITPAKHARKLATQRAYAQAHAQKYRDAARASYYRRRDKILLARKRRRLEKVLERWEL